MVAVGAQDAGVDVQMSPAAVTVRALRGLGYRRGPVDRTRYFSSLSLAARARSQRWRAR
jgi:hypothetical protein